MDDKLPSFTFEKDFYNLAFAAERLTIEDFSINGDHYCSRFIFGNRFTESGYTTTLAIGLVKVNRIVLSKWDYVTQTGKTTADFTKLHKLIFDRAPSEASVFSKDPAPHGNFPLWGIAREIPCGAKLMILHLNEFSVSDSSYTTPNPELTSIEKNLAHVEDAFGIALNTIGFLKQSVSLVFPYQQAYIDHWRLIRPSSRVEGVRVRIVADRFIRPWPELLLKLRLLERTERCFMRQRKY